MVLSHAGLQLLYRLSLRQEVNSATAEATNQPTPLPIRPILSAMLKSPRKLFELAVLQRLSRCWGALLLRPRDFSGMDNVSGPAKMVTRFAIEHFQVPCLCLTGHLITDNFRVGCSKGSVSLPVV